MTYLPVIAGLLAVMLYSILAKKLSVPAAIAGVLMGGGIFAATSYNGLAMLATFFGLGVIATAWKKDDKKGEGTVHPQTRTLAQVWANGGMALLLAIGVLVFPDEKECLTVMMAASLAAATADTLSSELGMVYGSNFYNIVSWKKEPKGLDGVISLEGTLIGMAGAVVIALVHTLQPNAIQHIVLIVIAGTIGNACDSLLGAVFERKQRMGNNMVNFLNTASAALFAWACY